MESKKDRLLLFNKEIAPAGFRYRLYFVSPQSLKEHNPKIRRLVCLRPRNFKNAALGKIYDLSFKRNHLKSLAEAGEEILGEHDYRNLITAKSRTFKPVRTVSAFRWLQEYASDTCYFPFEELKKINAYRREFLPTNFYRVLYAICRLFCLAVPCIAFVWSFFALSAIARPVPSEYARRFWLLPAYYFAAVPFMVYLMTLFWTLAETWLLRLDCFRWMVLKRHADCTGGLRRGIYLHKNQKTRLLKYGLITGGVYIFILLLVLLW